MPVPSVPSEQRSQGRWWRCQRRAWCCWRPPCPPPSRGRLPGSPGRCGSAWAPARAAAARSARAPAPVRAPSPALPAAPAAIPPFRPHGACPHSLHRRSGSGSGGPLGAAVMAGVGALVAGGGVAAVELAQAPGAGRDSSVEQCSCVGELSGFQSDAARHLTSARTGLQRPELLRSSTPSGDSLTAGPWTL